MLDHLDPSNKSFLKAQRNSTWKRLTQAITNLKQAGDQENGCKHSTTQLPSLLWLSLALGIGTILGISLLGNASAAGPNALPQTPKEADNSDLVAFDSKGRIDNSEHFADERIQGDSLALNSKNQLRGSQTYPVPSLERVTLKLRENGEVALSDLPKFATSFDGKVAGISSDGGNYVFYSINSKLQKYVETAVLKAKDLHVAVVAMEPKSGKILAIADKSRSIRDLSLHAGFPAASIFKLVTTAAALETSDLEPDSKIKFRGGTYTLNQWNYLPDQRRDRRSMPLFEALGRSCNPVFGRIALQYLTPTVLEKYSRHFGFNSSLDFELPLPQSQAFIPTQRYEMSLTGAGFGSVSLSPVHAAALVSGLANRGLMPRPGLVDRIVNRSGKVLYQSKPVYLSRLVQASTAQSMLQMMESTTTIGTSRKAFIKRGHSLLPGIHVAAKTGTLKGNDPEGINNWFVAAAPLEDPKIAVAVIVVDPVHINTKASEIGRMVIQQYLTGITPK